MDWEKLIESNELPLLRIGGALFALFVSARHDGSGQVVPRHVWRSILLVPCIAEAGFLRPSSSRRSHSNPN